MSRYRISASAERDLSEILAYVAANDGAERALHVHRRFAEAFDRIATMPGIGSRRPHLTGERVRWRAVFRWLVIYDAESRPPTILRVIHGGRLVAEVLADDAP